MCTIYVFIFFSLRLLIPNRSYFVYVRVLFLPTLMIHLSRRAEFENFLKSTYERFGITRNSTKYRKFSTKKAKTKTKRFAYRFFECYTTRRAVSDRSKWTSRCVQSFEYTNRDERLAYNRFQAVCKSFFFSSFIDKTNINNTTHIYTYTLRLSYRRRVVPHKRLLQGQTTTLALVFKCLCTLRLYG